MTQLNMTLEDILAKIRDKGQRVTAPRRAIIEYLMNSDTHPTVEEIYHDLRDQVPQISLATVYNNVNYLVDAGYLYEMKFSQGTSRYDFLGDRHFHIICKECGKIADFTSSDLSKINETAEIQTDYQVFQSKIELYGLCPDCQRFQSKD